MSPRANATGSYRRRVRVREDFAAGFMPLDSASAAWGFLTENGRRLLELSLPSWGRRRDLESNHGFLGPCRSSGSVSSGLLVRRPTRFFGVVVVGFYAAFMTASALGVYPAWHWPAGHLRVPGGHLSFRGRDPSCDRSLAARGARPARGGPADRRGWLPDWGLSHNGAKIHSKGARRLRNQYVLLGMKSWPVSGGRTALVLGVPGLAGSSE